MEMLKADWIKLKKPKLQNFYVLLYVEIQHHLIFATFRPISCLLKPTLSNLRLLPLR